MKATQLLKKDHQKVKGLIKKLKSARTKKEELIAQIVEEVNLHSQAEEQIFYPAYEEFDSEIVAESLEEHHQVDHILDELKQMTGDEGEEFEAKVTVLEEMLEHHMEEEEGEMFPDAEKKLKDQLEDLGAQIEEFKEDWTSRGERAA